MHLFLSPENYSKMLLKKMRIEFDAVILFEQADVFYGITCCVTHLYVPFSRQHLVADKLFK